MPKIAFLFPGQGAQAVGMGRALDRGTARGPGPLRPRRRGPRLRPPGRLLRRPGRGARGHRRQPAGDLRRQPRRARRPEGDRPGRRRRVRRGGRPEPGRVHGAWSSPGRSTSRPACGSSAAAARRCRPPAVATPSGMTSVLGLDEAKVDELCRPRRSARPALEGEHARPGQHRRLGRDSRPCEQVEPIATELGAMRVIPLAVAGAFHSDLMQPADDAARRGPGRRRRSAPRASRSTRTSTPRPTPTPTTSAGRSSPRSSPGVRWEDSMRRMLADGFDTFYEIGPGRVLTGLLKRIDRKVPCTSIPAR